MRPTHLRLVHSIKEPVIVKEKPLAFSEEDGIEATLRGMLFCGLALMMLILGAGLIHEETRTPVTQKPPVIQN